MKGRFRAATAGSDLYEFFLTPCYACRFSGRTSAAVWLASRGVFRAAGAPGAAKLDSSRWRRSGAPPRTVRSPRGEDWLRSAEPGAADARRGTTNPRLLRPGTLPAAALRFPIAGEPRAPALPPARGTDSRRPPPPDRRQPTRSTWPRPTPGLAAWEKWPVRAGAANVSCCRGTRDARVHAAERAPTDRPGDRSTRVLK